MRIRATKPIKERLTLRASGQEFAQTRTRIRRVATGLRHTERARLAISGHCAARPPRFSLSADMHPRVLQNFRESLELCGEKTLVIGCLFKLPRIASGKKRGSRRRALGRW